MVMRQNTDLFAVGEVGTPLYFCVLADCKQDFRGNRYNWETDDILHLTIMFCKASHKVNRQKPL